MSRTSLIHGSVCVTYFHNQRPKNRDGISFPGLNLLVSSSSALLVVFGASKSWTVQQCVQVNKWKEASEWLQFVPRQMGY